jgi:hypothetical protein
MPSILAPATVITGLTIAADTITTTSTTNIYPGQIGYISAAGQTTRRIRVVDVPLATTFRAKYEPKINDDNFRKPSTSGGTDAGYPGSAAPQDLSAYTGGSVFFEAQTVGVRGDYSKPSL